MLPPPPVFPLASLYAWPNRLSIGPQLCPPPVLFGEAGHARRPASDRVAKEILHQDIRPNHHGTLPCGPPRKSPGSAYPALQCPSEWLESNRRTRPTYAPRRTL